MEDREGKLMVKDHPIPGRVLLAAACAMLLAAGGVSAEPAAPQGVVSSVAPLPETPPLDRALESYLAERGDSPELRELVTHVIEVGGVDPALLAQLVVRADLNEIPPGDLVPVLVQVDRVVDDGLPVTPVVSRYLQGLAKNVPLARIHPVAEAVEARLTEAARHLDSLYDPAADRDTRLVAIDHAAYALAAGLAPEDLDRSLGLVAQERSGVDELRHSLLALSFMVSAGVESALSFEVVQTAWTHGFRGADLERLGATVGRLGHAGDPPGEIVSRVMNLIGTELPPERVFENLDALQPADGGLPAVSDPGTDPSRRRGGGDQPQIPPRNPDQRTGTPQRNGGGFTQGR